MVFLVLNCDKEDAVSFSVVVRQEKKISTKAGCG